jgi:RimJ/RimL family protein N-acetyltransferase
VKLNRYYQSMGFRFMGMHEVGEGKLVNLYQQLSADDNTELLILRYCGEADFQQLRHWSISAEYLQQWAGPSLTYPLDDRQLENYLAGANHPAESDKLVYCAVLGIEGIPAGHISLSAIDRKNGSARISRVVVNPELQGRGLGLRMVREVMRIAFEALGLHRLSLGVFDFNMAALKCYTAAGFVREGISREAALFGGEYADCIEMGILEREWQAITPN